MPFPKIFLPKYDKVKLRDIFVGLNGYICLDETEGKHAVVMDVITVTDFIDEAFSTPFCKISAN